MDRPAPLPREFMVGQIWQTRDGKRLFRVIAITDEPRLPVIVRHTASTFTDCVGLYGRTSDDPDDEPSSLDLVTIMQEARQ